MKCEYLNEKYFGSIVNCISPHVSHVSEKKPSSLPRRKAKSHSLIFQDLIVTLMIYPLQLLNWLLIQRRRNSTLIPSRANYSRKNNIRLIFINQAQTTIDMISTCSFCLPIFIKKCQNTYSSILKKNHLITYIHLVRTYAHVIIIRDNEFLQVS